VAAIVWVDLRDANGKLMGRYDPKRRLLEIQHRRVKTIFDLTQYEVPESTKESEDDDME